MTDRARDVYDDAAMILRLAVGGDVEAVAETLDDVVGSSDPDHAYQFAVCLAATMIGDGLPGGGAALDFPQIDEASYDARWVARFVSAYVNADGPTGKALFGAAIADGQLSDCMMTLTGSTLATLRHRTPGLLAPEQAAPDRHASA